MPAAKDLTGKRVGYLIVQERAGRDRHGNWLWRCLCNCGMITVTRASSLSRRTTLSCGCYNKEQVSKATHKRNLKHGKSKTKVYATWINLHYRRYKKKPLVCKRWRSFENFLIDMGEPPSKSHSIDRIDNSKGYEPGNCRWATMKEQQNNRTNNRLITFQGRTQTLQQWSDETGLGHKTILYRLHHGWPIEAVLMRPPSAKSLRPKIQLNTLKITYNNQTKTVREWSAITGLEPATIKQRLNRYGWSVEKTLTTKPYKGRRKT